MSKKEQELLERSDIVKNEQEAHPDYQQGDKLKLNLDDEFDGEFWIKVSLIKVT